MHLGGDGHCKRNSSHPKKNHTVSLARAQTCTAQTTVERTNHEATASPGCLIQHSTIDLTTRDHSLITDVSKSCIATNLVTI